MPTDSLYIISTEKISSTVGINSSQPGRKENYFFRLSQFSDLIRLSLASVLIALIRTPTIFVNTVFVYPHGMFTRTRSFTGAVKNQVPYLKIAAPGPAMAGSTGSFRLRCWAGTFFQPATGTVQENTTHYTTKCNVNGALNDPYRVSQLAPAYLIYRFRALGT